MNENNVFLTAGLQLGSIHKQVMAIINRQMVNRDEIKTTSDTLNLSPFKLKIKQKSKNQGSKEVKQLKTTDGL